MERDPDLPDLLDGWTAPDRGLIQAVEPLLHALLPQHFYLRAAVCALVLERAGEE